MYLLTRRFKLADKNRINEMVNILKRDFVPVLDKLEGLIDYHYVHSDGSVLVVSIFENRVLAEKSHPIIMDWVKKTIPNMYVGEPEIFKGEVLFHHEMMEHREKMAV